MLLLGCVHVSKVVLSRRFGSECCGHCDGSARVCPRVHSLSVNPSPTTLAGGRRRGPAAGHRCRRAAAQEVEGGEQEGVEEAGGRVDSGGGGLRGMGERGQG